MGNNPQTNQTFNPSSDGWRIKQKLDQVTIWQNKTNPSLQLEEYPFYISNEHEMERQISIFKLRKDHPTLVATKYFSNEVANDICSNHNKGSLFLERIPIRLCNITDIPFPDILYIYSQTIQGLISLKRQFGCLSLSQDKIGVNQEGIVKIWVNPQLDKNYTLPTQKLTQEAATRNLIQLIEKNTDIDSMPIIDKSIGKFLYRYNQSLTFQQALSKIRQYASIYNNGLIPSKLLCIERMGGTDTLVKRVQNPDKSLATSKIGQIKTFQQDSLNNLQLIKPSNDPIYRHPNTLSASRVNRNTVSANFAVTQPVFINHKEYNLRNQPFNISENGRMRQNSMIVVSNRAQSKVITENISYRLAPQPVQFQPTKSFVKVNPPQIITNSQFYKPQSVPFQDQQRQNNYELNRKVGLQIAFKQNQAKNYIQPHLYRIQSNIGNTINNYNSIGLPHQKVHKFSTMIVKEETKNNQPRFFQQNRYERKTNMVKSNDNQKIQHQAIKRQLLQEQRQVQRQIYQAQMKERQMIKKQQQIKQRERQNEQEMYQRLFYEQEMHRRQLQQQYIQQMQLYERSNQPISQGQIYESQREQRQIYQQQMYQQKLQQREEEERYQRQNQQQQQGQLNNFQLQSLKIKITNNNIPIQNQESEAFSYSNSQEISQVIPAEVSEDRSKRQNRMYFQSQPPSNVQFNQSKLVYNQIPNKNQQGEDQQSETQWQDYTQDKPQIISKENIEQSINQTAKNSVQIKSHQVRNQQSSHLSQQIHNKNHQNQQYQYVENITTYAPKNHNNYYSVQSHTIITKTNNNELNPSYSKQLLEKVNKFKNQQQFQQNYIHSLNYSQQQKQKVDNSMNGVKITFSNIINDGNDWNQVIQEQVPQQTLFGFQGLTESHLQNSPQSQSRNNDFGQNRQMRFAENSPDRISYNFEKTKNNDLLYSFEKKSQHYESGSKKYQSYFETNVQKKHSFSNNDTPYEVFFDPEILQDLRHIKS